MSTIAPPAATPTAPHALGWLLAAEAVSLVGSRITLVAVPWLVLETTGSAGQTGVVAFAEMLPYVAACALGGPLIDRHGPRPASLACDLVSAGVVGLVPLLYGADLLPLPALAGVMALAGGLRGLGDTAKRTLFPAAVEASDADLTRATGARDGMSRLAEMLGAPLGGLLIAALGAAQVLLIDAASFALTAAIVAVGVRSTARPADRPAPEPYGAALRTGFAQLRRDPLISGVVLVALATNLLDSAYLAVYVPVWAHDVAGSAQALGLVFGAFGVGAVTGNVLFNTFAPYLPRYATFAVCFLLGGTPNMLVMAATDSLAPIMVVGFASGMLSAPVNPILAAVAYERVPPELHARVMGLIRALSWAGIPLGGLLGGLLVARLGLTPALLLTAALYLLASLIPLTRPTWHEMDNPRPPPQKPPTVDHPATHMWSLRATRRR